MYRSGRDRWVVRVAGRVAALTLVLVLILPLAPLVADVAPPVPLAPADGTTVVPSPDTPLAIPEFRWSAVAGATKYRLQVSRDNFATLALNITTANTSYTPTDASPFADGSWQWRVRSEAPAPVGDWSAVWEFQKDWSEPSVGPALLSPSDPVGPFAFFEGAVFSWEPVIGAASYRLEIATSDTGWSTARIYTTLNVSLQPTAKLPNGEYWWRVVPLDVDGRPGTPSEIRHFTVDYSLRPVLIGPGDDTSPTFTPTFTWEAVRGAQRYVLQYSSDFTFSAGVTQIVTRNTAYTPLDDLPNDVNFFWRVRAESGDSVGPWSHDPGQEWSFVKRWYLQPVLLTPTNGFQHVDKPFFSWTPVPGARRYKFEISDSLSFATNYYSEYTANPYFHVPVGKRSLTQWPTVWYWRVTPYDANNNAGKASNVSSFSTSPTPAPMLISPLFYYTPSDYGEDAALNPHEDRTAALPVFAWTRVLFGANQAVAYRLEVSTGDAVRPDGTFASTVWVVDTESLFATPTEAKPFAPEPGITYYWHVAALDSLDGTVQTPWSEIWRARFAQADLPAPGAAGTAPELLRPAQGSEWTEATPLLEWRPVDGADAYDVQIFTEPQFAGTPAGQARVYYPAYSPTRRLAYDGGGVAALPYGTYYWRVRAIDGGAEGPWSGALADGQPARFQIAAQSRWREARTLGNAANRVLIAADGAGDVATSEYDLSTLHAAQSADYWYFGFHVAASAAANYVLYLDVDHVANSGGSSDPLGYAVTALPAHRPEYVIHVGNGGADPAAAYTRIYRWTGTAWDTPQNLATIGGALSYADGYLEVQVPNTSIGMQETTNSLALALFSAPAAGGAPADIVPPTTDGAVLSRFASVSDRLMLVSPANLNRVAAEGVTFPTLPPMRWHPPVDVDCYGYYVQAALDSEFTSKVLDFSYRTNNTPGFEPPFLPYIKDLTGDNTYYWRVRPYYWYNGGSGYLGSWSQAFALERQGFVIEAPQASVPFATPTFSWDRVEGASGYDLQVSTDPAFGSSVFAPADLARNTYTWTSTLANATYFWRVRVRRDGGILNDWSPAESLSLQLPTPRNLTHTFPLTGEAVRMPTLCWDYVLAEYNSVPVLAAWKYRVQISRDGFSSILDQVDTEQACWTPTEGYNDGPYQWRVAMIDGESKVGLFSDPAGFSKTYPRPPLLAPGAGEILPATPTFAWQPLDGAARYKVEVSTVLNFGTTYDSVTTDTVRWTPTKAYSAGVTYYWRVTMIDKDGRPGSPEEPRAFRVDPYLARQNPVFLPRVSMR